MSHSLRLLPFLFLLLVTPSAWSQSFTVTATPDTRSVIVGEQPSFTITVTPADGFAATVFLRVSAPTLSPAGVALAPKSINAPYTTTATLTITPTPSDTGVHTIIVEGKNNAMVRYDTITLTVGAGTGGTDWVLYHTGNSGLPSLNITAIAFDSSGNTWIGTSTGLARATPGHAPERIEGEFTDMEVKAIAVDSGNNVWVITNYIDRAQMRYSNGIWTEIASGADRVRLRDVNTLAAASDGTIWAGGRSGLSRLENGVWTQFTPADWGGTTSREIIDLALSSTGDLWALTAGAIDDKPAIVKFDGSFWTVWPGTSLGTFFWGTGQITVDESDSAWALTASGLVSPGLPDVVRRSIPGEGTVITSGVDGQLWIGLSSPRMLYAEEGDWWKPYPLTDAGLPPVTSINEIAVDRDGNVWVGTGAGLAVLKSGRGPLSSVPAGRALVKGHLAITPNPLGSNGLLELTADGGLARVSLHDNLGRRVATLFEGEIAPGDHALRLDLSGVPAGTYLLDATVDGVQIGSRMIVVTR